MTPRKEIENAITENDLELLMKSAAQIHGHYCPGLALGVIASTYAMNKLKSTSDGLEDLIAITETNNCFSDGVQYVTGCTFGNNALVFKDLGKTAFTLCKRDGKGIRMIASKNSRERIRNVYPEFSALYQKLVKEKNHSETTKKAYKEAGIKRAFATLNIPASELFDIYEVNVELPEYAPSHQSFECKICNEEVMATRISDDKICLSCKGKDYYQLDGHGIKKI